MVLSITCVQICERLIKLLNIIIIIPSSFLPAAGTGRKVRVCPANLGDSLGPSQNLLHRECIVSNFQVSERNVKFAEIPPVI